MQRTLILLLIVVLLNCNVRANEASTADVSLKLNKVELRYAIQTLADILHMNVVVHPSVAGIVDMNISRASAKAALDMLLLTHQLSQYKKGNIVLIGTHQALHKIKEEEIKYHQLLLNSQPMRLLFWHFKYARVEDFAHLLLNERFSLLSKRGRYSIDPRTNTVTLKDSPIHLLECERFLNEFDVPVQQVHVEARLVSIDSDFEKEFGAYFLINQHVSVEANGHFAIVKLADHATLDVKLAMLQRKGHADLLSSPSLFVSNRETAFIESGEEVPYQQIAESGGTAVTFKKAVLGLKVTPEILPGNKILLRLLINQDRPNNQLILGVPTISTRKIKTSVLIKDGQTLVLGGIYELNGQKSEIGLPYLSQLPLIGALFKQQHGYRNKRELLIFVTPKII